MEETVLDNPAWEALLGQQKGFAVGTAQAMRYRQGILPFAGCSSGALGSMETLDPFVNAGESLYIIGDGLPALPAGWVVVHDLPCAQMVLRQPLFTAIDTADGTELLGDADAGDMFDLINSVQPGYYNTGTRLLGTYYGIRDAGKLVAMAGERMRLDGYSELSAICTSPLYTGRGYAQKLMARLCNRHAAANTVSFLHVTLTNQRAIRLYEHMGFEQRRTIVFRQVKKQ